MDHPINSVFTGRGNEGVQVGSNSGAIYYSAAPQSAGIRNHTEILRLILKLTIMIGTNIEPPTPCTNIPFKRDSGFIARRTLVDQIHERCALPSSRAALVGLGGIG